MEDFIAPKLSYSVIGNISDFDSGVSGSYPDRTTKIYVMRNTDPFAPWNDPMYKDDPLAPHNDPMYKNDPFKPWNDPLGSERDLDREERRRYGLIESGNYRGEGDYY